MGRAAARAQATPCAEPTGRGRGIVQSIRGGKPGETHDTERTFVEIFSWTSSEGPALAHQTPGVMAVWEPMGAICEEMGFPSFERLKIDYEE